jgi:lipopolysaccharide transport system permease protein
LFRWRTCVGLLDPFRVLIDSREIVYQLARQRLVRRFRGSFLGAIWLFLSPAITLALYTLVFGVMLKNRWRVDSTDTGEYALLLYLGLCIFWFFSEVVSEAPTLIINNPSYVKKVVFPTESLLWVLVAYSLALTTLRISVFVVACLLMQGQIPVTVLLLPLVWVPLVLYAVGIGWILASIGTFLRDVGEIVSLALMAIFFLSPVLYPVNTIPDVVQWIVSINPLTVPIQQARELAYFGTFPDPNVWLVQLAMSMFVAWAGLALFCRSKRIFGDVV